MFFNCTKLNYLNIQNYNNKSEPIESIITKIIGNTTKNIAICIGINKYSSLQKKINDNKYCAILDCSEKYYKNQNLINSKRLIYYN